MPIVDPSLWPRPLDAFPGAIAGLFVGGCVARGDGSRFRHQAHAHTNGPHLGWICVLAARRLDEYNLMAHEVAHILIREGHTNLWRRTHLFLGGTLEQHEHQRTRKLKSPRHPALGYQHHPDCPCGEVLDESPRRHCAVKIGGGAPCQS